MSAHAMPRPARWHALVLPAAIALAWIVLAQSGQVKPQVFVPVGKIGQAFVDSVASGALPAALGATLLRALGGFVLGAVAGLGVGLLLAVSGGARRLFGPTFNGAQQIALFAWIPLLSAWLGTGELMKVTLIALGSFFPVLLNVEAGCRTVSAGYREIGRVLELTRGEQLLRIIVPAALPQIASGLEIGFASAWLGTVGTEYLVGSGYVNGLGDGLGVFLAAAREFGQMDRVIVGIVVLALTGLALDRLVVLTCRKLMPWQT